MVTSQGHFPPVALAQIAPKSVRNDHEWAAMLERWSKGTLHAFKRLSSPSTRASRLSLTDTSTGR
jgi:hypothetical protein